MMQQSTGIVVLILSLLLTQTLVKSHHGVESEHGVDSHHSGDEAHSDHEHEAKGTLKHKFISISTWPRLRPKPTMIYVFNTESYDNWTDWSECLPRDCIQVRSRKCLDDSWKEQIDDQTRAPGCVSKYYAEKRTCLNITECHRTTGEKLLYQWQKKCGLQPSASRYETKILGGNAVKPHSWPWTVRLSVRSRSGKSISFCGGTLVTPNLVVTAAHCLVSLNARIPAGKPFKLSSFLSASLYAHVGDHNLAMKEKAQQDIRIDQAIIHPQYHRKLLTDGFDFALLYLSQPINISREASLACLPPQDIKLKPGTKCVAVGWGSNKKPETSNFDSFQSILEAVLRPPPFMNPFGASSWPWRKRRQRRKPAERTGTVELHEVELPIIDNDKCQKHFIELNTDLNICAGSSGKDTCSGDSGGGLYCRLPESNRWYLAGVTSYGLALGCGHNPGVYTSVKSHLEWITNNMINPA